MPTPSLAFAATLQDDRTQLGAPAMGEVLEELLPCIPFVKLPGAGETLEVARVTGSVAALSAFRAITTARTTGTATDSSFTFTFRRIDSLAQDDLTLVTANSQPNDLTEADRSIRNASILWAPLDIP